MVSTVSRLPGVGLAGGSAKRYASGTSMPIGVGHRVSAVCRVRRRRLGEASGLEDALQALEVLAEVALGTPGHDPGREAGQQSCVPLADDVELRPAPVRLELVPHAERHRTVERPQREEARALALGDLEPRAELAP